MAYCGFVSRPAEFVPCERFAPEAQVKRVVRVDRHDGFAAPQAGGNRRVDLEDPVPPSDGVVVRDGSLLLFAQDVVKIERPIKPPVRIRL